MSLLVPDTGLLFWMTLSFLIVLFVLGRFGFPVILKAVEKRHSHIVNSLEAAHAAQEKLAGIEKQAKVVMDKAQADSGALILEARRRGDEIVEKAKVEAEQQASQRMARAVVEAEQLKRRAMEEVMEQIAGISVKIAGKVVGEELESGPRQQKLIERLLKEEINKEA